MLGIKILDLSRVLAGPWAVQQLADQGADVIKVEPPGGDDTRGFGPFKNDVSTYFLSCNRNKRSIVLDLKTNAGKRTLLTLIDWADVVVENYREQACESLGLHILDLLETRPKLVWVSIRAFGTQNKTWANRPGYDLLLQCMGGATALTGTNEMPPLKHGNSSADLTTGLMTSQAILLGLLHKERTGEGQHIVVNMLQTQAVCLTYHATRITVTNQSPEKRGNSHAGLVPYDLYPVSDGWVAIAVGNDRMWRDLCAELSIPQRIEWATNRQRLKHRAQIDDAIQTALASWTVEEVTERLSARDVPAGPVLRPEETLQHPATQHIDVEHPSLGTIMLPGVPLQTSTTRTSHRAPPMLNADEENVLDEICKSVEKKPDVLNQRPDTE